MHAHDQNRVLAFHRWVEGEGHDVIVVVHLSTFNRFGYRIGFPGGGSGARSSTATSTRTGQPQHRRQRRGGPHGGPNPARPHPPGGPRAAGEQPAGVRAVTHITKAWARTLA